MKINKKAMTKKSFIFWTSAAIFILLIFYLKGSFHASPNTSMFLLAAILAIICFFLIIMKLLQNMKEKASEGSKTFLAWIGSCSITCLIGIVVYNLF